MKCGTLLFVLLSSVCLRAEVIEVHKIWDRAAHNAFTDLIRFQDKWFCVFREGTAHVSPDGALRVIVSPDGDRWESAALMTSESADLRDAKITITPAGQLMLSGVAAMGPTSRIRHQTLAWFSADGHHWSEPVKIGEPDFWLWRVTWHDGTAYGIGYSTTVRKQIRLYKSDDGKNFSTWVDKLYSVGYPNESSLVFLDDATETCVCLLRRDGSLASAQLGTSPSPYQAWQWKDLGVRIGGPHLIRLSDGRLVAAGRDYVGGTRTKLWWLDPHAGKLKEIVTLPSGGDTSYPGLVYHDGLLWVSYYASDGRKASIHLAKVKLPVSRSN